MYVPSNLISSLNLIDILKSIQGQCLVVRTVLKDLRGKTILKNRCSADSTQSAVYGLPTMVDTNQLVPDLDFIPSTPDIASFSDDFVS